MRYLRWLGYAVGVVWALPQLVVALLLMAWYRPKKVRWHKGCLEFIAGRKLDKDGNDRTRIWGQPDGQSLGCPVIAFATEEAWDDPELGRHERTHTLQGFVLGPLMGPFYGVDWVAHRLFATPDEPPEWPPWKRAYWAMWLEQHARSREKDKTNWGT